MSDNPETPATAPHQDGKAPEIPKKPEETPAQEVDWKAEARKWEQRAKENKTAAERLAEIEEASKTEAQKQAERLAEYEAKVEEYEAREQVAAWKAEVSRETGVPAAVLAGSTKEEIEAHAESLKPLIAQAEAPAGHRPIPSEGQPQPLALNSNGLEAALKSALGIK